jgi:hypothetical protein
MPLCLVDVTELATPDFGNQLELLWIDLPLVHPSFIARLRRHYALEL